MQDKYQTYKEITEVVGITCYLIKTITKMIKRKIYNKTTISRNVTVEGETIEQKVERIVINKEPIEDSAPIIYQDRSEGVRPEFNIRTDRFEVAIDAMDNVSKSRVAKRNEYAKQKKEDKDKSAGAEPIQATE